MHSLRLALPIALVTLLVAGCVTPPPTYSFNSGTSNYDRSTAAKVYQDLFQAQAGRLGADRPIKLLAAPMPDYPIEMQRAQVGGQVVMQFTVQPDGSVSNVVAVSSPNRGLVRACAEALRNWRFEPIEKGGVKTAVVFEIPFTFNAPS